MKVLTDIHTHTVASGHAHSTLMENINVAVQRGLELIAITEHDIHTTRTLDVHYFGSCINHLPETINGVTLLKGVEVNILDATGKLGVDEKTLDRLDIVIASCHPPTPSSPTFVPDNDESFLKTYKAVIDNLQVDILGHITMCPHLKYLDEIINLAKAKNKLIEINNSHFVNPRSEKSVKLLIEICMNKKASVVVNSDAHFCTQVGDFDMLCEYLKQIKFPEELIINRTKETLLEFLGAKRS